MKRLHLNPLLNSLVAVSIFSQHLCSWECGSRACREVGCQEEPRLIQELIWLRDGYGKHVFAVVENWGTAYQKRGLKRWEEKVILLCGFKHMIVKHQTISIWRFISFEFVKQTYTKAYIIIACSDETANLSSPHQKLGSDHWTIVLSLWIQLVQ